MIIELVLIVLILIMLFSNFLSNFMNYGTESFDELNLYKYSLDKKYNIKYW